MRPQDIVVGNSYRFKSNPRYGYVKVLAILKPKQAENTKTYTVLKCEHSVDKNDKFGFIRYFRPCELRKEEE